MFQTTNHINIYKYIYNYIYIYLELQRPTKLKAQSKKWRKNTFFIFGVFI